MCIRAQCPRGLMMQSPGGGDHACADGAPALAEREPDAGLECDRAIERQGDLGAATGRDLLLDPERRGHVGGADEQLRPVAGADRLGPPAFPGGQQAVSYTHLTLPTSD